MNKGIKERQGGREREGERDKNKLGLEINEKCKGL